MCRSIVTLRGEPPVTDAEVRAAALQFVRKVSGYRAPSKANQDVFERAVDEVAVATQRLLDDLVDSAKPPSARAQAERQRTERYRKVTS
jgi:hypothetical protein